MAIDLNCIEFYQPPGKAAKTSRKKAQDVSGSHKPNFPIENGKAGEAGPARLFDITNSPLPDFPEQFFPWESESKSVIRNSGRFLLSNTLMT